MNPHGYGNPYGDGSNGAAPRIPPHTNGVNREKISFRVGTPRMITLEHDPPSESKDGNWGPQFQYKLAGNQIAWLDPDAHEQLVGMGARAGGSYVVTKGRNNAWTVKAAGLERARTVTPAPRPQPVSTPPVEPVPVPKTHVSGNLMAASLRSAIDAVKDGNAYAAAIGLDMQVDATDLAKLAITIYIQNSKGGL